MSIGEKIDHYEKAIYELKETESFYKTTEVLILEILLDILRELVRQR